MFTNVKLTHRFFGLLAATSEEMSSHAGQLQKTMMFFKLEARG